MKPYSVTEQNISTKTDFCRGHFKKEWTIQVELFVTQQRQKRNSCSKIFKKKQSICMDLIFNQQVPHLRKSWLSFLLKLLYHHNKFSKLKIDLNKPFWSQASTRQIFRFDFMFKWYFPETYPSNPNKLISSYYWLVYFEGYLHQHFGCS